MVLVIDDDERSRRVLSDVLAAVPAHVLTAASGTEALALCSTLAPDVVLLDLMMPEMDGFELLTRLRANARFALVPILVISAYDDREAKVRAFDLGADDFITKPFDRVELRARVLAATRYHRTRRLAEERARFEQVVSVSFDGIVVVDAQGQIAIANPAFSSMLGVEEPRLLVRQSLADFVAPAHVPLLRTLVAGGPLDAMVPAGASDRLDLLLRPANAGVLPVELTYSRIPWDGGLATCLIVRDDTELRRLEAEVRQLQKLETMGSFALGIAHDFANVLQAMGVAAREIMHATSRHNGAPDLSEALADLNTAIARGAAMTRHLLAFVRKHPSAPSLLDPSTELHETTAMLRRLLPADIVLDVLIDDQLPLVRMARTELEQVLINLVVNARNALGAAGCIAVRLASDGADWIVLEVSDNGPGLGTAGDEGAGERREEAPSGTGLGLGIVRRIVYGARGEFAIESGPNGTCCRVRLRAVPLPMATSTEGAREAASRSSVPSAA